MEKKLLSVLLISVAITLIIGILPVRGEKKIYDSVIRLHVLANSDNDADQELKLKVRDGILKYTEDLLSGCKTKEEAEELIKNNLEGFALCARRTLAENGSSHSVDIDFGKEYYPTRDYDSVAFPGGEYLSLRIKIGEAEGKNWWCVLFPPICLSAASEKNGKGSMEEAFVAVGLTPEQYKIVTESKEGEGKYKIRFKILEVLRELAKVLNDNRVGGGD